MTRYPTYLKIREVPDEKILKTIKEMVKDGKSPKKIKSELSTGELSTVSLYIIIRYYTKIRKGIW